MVQKTEHSDNTQGAIVLNSTAEFCRTLGDIPTYGRAGNREEEEDDSFMVKYKHVFIKLELFLFKIFYLFQDYDKNNLKQEHSVDSDDSSNEGWKEVEMGMQLFCYFYNSIFSLFLFYFREKVS